MSDPGEVGFSLVMPLVIVESAGGQYDDRSFVAGWECAHVHDLLAHARGIVTLTVHAGSLPQLDLAAMDRGFVMEHEGDDEWAFVTFRPSHPLRRVEP